MTLSSSTTICVASSTSTVPTITKSSSSGVVQGPATRPITVLVVDDDDDIREALCDILRDDGFGAVGARNGAEGLCLLRSGCQADVIVLDLMMPIMDGWQFRHEQQADATLSMIPVIVITAAGSQKLPSAACVLMKPLRAEAIIDAIHAAVGPA